MATIKKDTLHPENEPEVDIYPKTSIDQVENLQANLDALNGDIANVNGEIANISTNVENIANKVGDINKDVSTLKYNDTNQDRRIQVLENTSGTTINRVEIAEKNITDLQNDVNQNIIDISDIKDDITVLNTAYGSYTDYTEVTNGFLLTYLSGKQIELPIKAGTNVTFSKYPGTNQIIINATGGSVPNNIAILNANNTFTGSNTFNNNIQVSTTITLRALNDNIIFSTQGITKNNYSFMYPNQSGTIALTTDIPTLADYPTTIFFNNYNAGIGYKDTSTGTTKTVVSTDNNGAQIVIGDSNTGLTLATNARPKVLEDSTVKEVAYVSDIPNTSSFATLAGNNKWTGDNIFDGFSKSIRVNGLFQVSGDEEPISATYNQVSYDGFNIAYMVGENQNIFHVGIDFENKARFGFDKYDGSSYNLYIPEKDGTIALLSDIPNTSSFPTLAGSNNWTGQNVFDNGITMGTTEYTPEGPHVYYGDYRADYGERWISTQYQDKSGVLNLPQGKSGTLALIEDIPISLMYSSSKLGVNFVDFPFNIDKNYFFTITMTNTGESKSFIYARGINATYTIVVNSSTSFEVKLDATGSSTRLIFTNKSNADPFVVRAEISN